MVEENYDIEEINLRKQRLIDSLQENINELASASNQENYIINLYVREFTWQAKDFESIYALKLVLESVFEDYEMNTEEVFYNILELMPDEDEYSANAKFELNSKNIGYIYLMMNPSMNGIIKIGLTRRSPEERMEELSKATGVPTPFILVYKEQFNDCVHAEKMIHTILEERGERVSASREFFSTEISEAIKIIQQVKQNDVVHVSSDYAEDSSDWYDEKPISKEYLEKGINYLNGYGNYLQDYERAIEYLEKAGELGEAQAYYELGKLHIDTMKDEEFTLDAKKGIRYFEKGRVLKGKYANYCNAGLALCYVNNDFRYAKIKHYSKNEANASKSWEWFFQGVDFNRDDYNVKYFIIDFLREFLFNDECSSVYKNKLEQRVLPLIKQCRYSIYSFEKNSIVKNENNINYLLSKFDKHQLDREVIVNWLPKKEIHLEDGINFYVDIQQGTLKLDDILSFDGYGGAYRYISKMYNNGEKEVQILTKGEQGRIQVDSILDDFDGFLSDNLKIEVIGNSTLEEIKEDINLINVDVDYIEKTVTSNGPQQPSSENGLLKKVKGWFK